MRFVWLRVGPFHVSWPVAACDKARLGECAWTARTDNAGLGLR